MKSLEKKLIDTFLIENEDSKNVSANKLFDNIILCCSSPHSQTAYIFRTNQYE